MKDTASQIETFLKSPAFGIVGASKDRSKYGNKVLRCYLQHNKKVYPLNLHEDTVEGVSCLKKIEDLPIEVESISIITPPLVTLKIVEAALAKGIKNMWMQPGAEHPLAIQMAEQKGANVIANGPCILVELGFHE